MKRLRALAVFSILSALVAHFGVFYFLGIRAPVMRTPVKQDFEIYYLNDASSSLDPAMVQQGILLDSAPLFMPTRWNLGSDLSGVASLQQATEVFRPFPPELQLPESYPASPWSTVPSNEWVLKPLTQDPHLLLARFGRTIPVIPEPPVRGPQVSALRLDAEEPGNTLTLPLPANLNSQAPDTFWNPVRFYLHLTWDVPVGAPLMVQSSGYTDWDNALQAYVGSLDFYRSVGSGYYRISVFP